MKKHILLVFTTLFAMNAMAQKARSMLSNRTLLITRIQF